MHPLALALLLASPNSQPTSGPVAEAPCVRCEQAKAHGFARLREGRYRIVMPAAEIAPAAPPLVEAPFSDATREADIFGGGGEAPPPPPPPPKASSLKAGGRLDIQHDVYFNEDTDLGDQPLDPRYHLRLYADARPSEGSRAYTQARITFEPGEDLGGVTTLEQAWLKLNGERAFVTLGIQPIRWGSGRIWNPSDVLNAARRDPLLSMDLRPGVSAARVEAPFERGALSGGLQLITLTEGAHQLDEVGAASRLSLAYSPFEVILSALRRGGATTLAFEGSGGLGPFEIYAEGSLSEGVERRWRRGGFTPDKLWEALAGSAEDAPVAEPIEGWVGKALVGLEWPTTLGGDQYHLGAEYLYNGAGDDDEALYLWRLLQGDPALYLGRHYAGVYALAIDPGPLTHTQLLLTALGNLSDGSGLARLTVVYTRETLRVEPYVGGRFGAASGELRLKTQIPALGASPETQIGPLRGEAGIWLRAGF